MEFLAGEDFDFTDWFSGPELSVVSEKTTKLKAFNGKKIVLGVFEIIGKLCSVLF